MKIFGVSLMTLLLIAAVAIVVQKFGNNIPLLNQIK